MQRREMADEGPGGGHRDLDGRPVPAVRRLLPGREDDGFGVTERIRSWDAGQISSGAGVERPVGHEDFEAFRAHLLESGAVIVALRFGAAPLEGLNLEAWLAYPSEGRSRAHVAAVSEDDLPAIASLAREDAEGALRRRFGWAIGDNLHGAPRTEPGWRASDPGFAGRGSGWWNETWTAASWAAFEDEFGAVDPAGNAVFDWRLVPTSPHPDPDGHDLPAAFGVEMWMAVPRKDTERAVVVHNVRREDGPALRSFLRRSFEHLQTANEWTRAFPEPDGAPPPGPRR